MLARFLSSCVTNRANVERRVLMRAAVWPSVLERQQSPNLGCAIEDELLAVFETVTLLGNGKNVGRGRRRYLIRTKRGAPSVG